MLWYRLSHTEVCKVKQLWGVEGSIILLTYLWCLVASGGLEICFSSTSPFLWNTSSTGYPIFQGYLILFLSKAVEASRCHFFWKLVDGTQISKPPEATRGHNSIKSLILPPLRADLLCILHYETPRSLLYRRKDFLSKSLLGRCVVEWGQVASCFAHAVQSTARLCITMQLPPPPPQRHRRAAATAV